jgi:hypothetical protein
VPLACLQIALLGGPAQSELRRGDLELTRSITDEEWLRVQLDLLALRLSYPAYRISLLLDEENVIAFTFLNSSGLADDMVKMGRADTEKMLKYHAEGIGFQVESMIENLFPRLWSSFDGDVDFKGEFLVPGENPEDGARKLAYWRRGRFHWSK